MNGRLGETPVNQTTASVSDHPVAVTLQLRGDLLVAVAADGTIRVLERFSSLEPYLEGLAR